ncbi:Zn-dependent hydrolase [Hyphococcus sp.]|uniref:Zn-dependent hydrolase n=1 Tax=Hyphococcus sp. TaxID=2038636 RepID=UPI003CCBFBB2
MKLIAVAGCFSALAMWSQALAQDLPRANASRMEARIEQLSAFGANDDGGVDRVAYSEADIAARAWAMDLMRALDLENVRIDAGGNILATRPGTDPEAKPIMFGSHIDSVLGGGNYDGNVGVIAAFEAIDLLNEAAVETRSPLEVVIFSNEEGGLIGSLAMTGALKPETLEVMSDASVTIGEGTRKIGGDPDKLDNDIIEPDALKAFLEVHIEQGAILDEEDIDIGVVEGIVGIEWWDVTVTGVANHAGTTPMNRRSDALLAASKLVQAVNDIAVSTPGRHVATVGRIKALPGAPNVIPGEVVMSLEIRDLETDKMTAIYEQIERAAGAIADESGVDITFEHIDVASHPALTDERIRQTIAAAAETLGLSFMHMPSGAGHDAQDMARIAPTGMIFAPSVGGVSHSPKEFTAPQDMANAADVLLRTIITIDAEK